MVSYERSLIPFALRNNLGFAFANSLKEGALHLLAFANSLKEGALHLLEELERALLGDVAELTQLGDRLLASRVLLLADDAARLRLHQVTLLQATGRVLRRAVENLRLAADRSNLAAVLSGVASILTSNIRHFILIV